jgi:hypothetical protein
VVLTLPNHILTFRAKQLADFHGAGIFDLSVE